MYSKKFRVTMITLTAINIICYMLYMREDNHQIYGNKYIKQEYALERYVPLGKTSTDVERTPYFGPV